MSEPIWNKFLTDRDKAVFGASGYGARGGFGKRPALLGSKILDEQGNECPTGVPGAIYHQLPPGGGFTYYKDEAKTQANRVGDYFTMGDVGDLTSFCGAVIDERAFKKISGYIDGSMPASGPPKNTGAGCCVRHSRIDRYTIGTSIPAKIERIAPSVWVWPLFENFRSTR